MFNPGPIRTRMRATAMPGEDPMTLDTPENCAEKIVDLCLPSYVETGTLYSYRVKKFLTLSAAVVARAYAPGDHRSRPSTNSAASRNGVPGSWNAKLRPDRIGERVSVNRPGPIMFAMP